MARYGTYNSPGGFKLTVYGIAILFAFFAMFYFTRSMYRENNVNRPGAQAVERIVAAS